MKIFKAVIITLIALALVVGGLIVKTYYDAGEFKNINPHFNAECKTISGVLSSEDITIDQKTGLAFISSADRRTRWSGSSHVQKGAIYGLDLKTRDPELINLTADFAEEFNPHGIGLWIGEDGNPSLFVVNHRKDGHFVEIFDFKDNRLIHRESIEGALMHSPNDVIPVGPRAFYVTNDHGNRSELGRLVEEYLQLARSLVLYYDGHDFRIVAEGLAYSNGINLSPDGRTVYVAATVGQEICVYDRDKGSGDLKLRHTINLGTGPDNIEVDEGGNLWIGCHPKLLTFVKYSKDRQELSPSQVLKVIVQKPGSYTVDEIYLNNGEPLSGSSVAAVFEKTMLIGSVFDTRLLLCNLQK
jgi:arylesterase / paraoxonase